MFNDSNNTEWGINTKKHSTLHQISVAFTYGSQVLINLLCGQHSKDWVVCPHYSNLQEIKGLIQNHCHSLKKAVSNYKREYNSGGDIQYLNLIGFEILL